MTDLNLVGNLEPTRLGGTLIDGETGVIIAPVDPPILGAWVELLQDARLVTNTKYLINSNIRLNLLFPLNAGNGSSIILKDLLSGFRVNFETNQVMSNDYFSQALGFLDSRFVGTEVLLQKSKSNLWIATVQTGYIEIN